MIEFPSWLEWLGAAIGMEWPHGNEDDMWALAGDWHTAADELREILHLMDEAKSATLAAYPAGDGQQQMSDTFDSMRSGKDSLEALAGYFDQIGDSVDGGGTQIQYTKLMFYSTLVITAADIAAVWIFPPTAPAEEAGIIVATRVAVRVMFRRMLSTMAGWAGRLAENALVRFLFRHVLLNAALGALQEFAVQEIQIWQGHRKGLDLNQLGVTTFAAGVGGAAGGGVGEALGRKFGNAFRNEAGDITSKWGVNLTRAGIGASSGLVNSAAAFGGSIAWQFGSDLAHGNLDTALDNLKNTHVDWRMFSAGAITGGGSALNHNFAHNHFENSPFWKLNAPRVDLGNIGDLHNFQHDGTVPNVHVDAPNGNGLGANGNGLLGDTQAVHGDPGSSGPVRGGPVSNGHDSHAGGPTVTAGTHEAPVAGAGLAPEHTAPQDHSDTSALGPQKPAHDRAGPVDSSVPSDSESGGPVASESSSPVGHQGATGHDSTPPATSDTPVSHTSMHESPTPAAASGPEGTHSQAETPAASTSGASAAEPSTASGPAATSGPAASSGPPAASGPAVTSGPAASSGPVSSSPVTSSGPGTATGASPIDARGASPVGGSDAPRTGDIRTPDARTGTDGRPASDLNRGTTGDGRTPARAGSADTPGARPAADSRVQARVTDSESPRAGSRAGTTEGDRTTAKPGRTDTGTAQERAGTGPRPDKGPGGEPSRDARDRPENVRTPGELEKPVAPHESGEDSLPPERDSTAGRDRDESVSRNDTAPRDEAGLRDEAGPRDEIEPRDEAGPRDTTRPLDEAGPHDEAASHDSDKSSPTDRIADRPTRADDPPAQDADPGRRDDQGTLDADERTPRAPEASTPDDPDAAGPARAAHTGVGDGERAAPRDVERGGLRDPERAGAADSEHAAPRDSDGAGRSDSERARSVDGERAALRDSDGAAPRDGEHGGSKDGERTPPRDAEGAGFPDAEGGGPRDGGHVPPRDSDSGGLQDVEHAGPGEGEHIGDPVARDVDGKVSSRSRGDEFASLPAESEAHTPAADRTGDSGETFSRHDSVEDNAAAASRDDAEARTHPADESADAARPHPESDGAQDKSGQGVPRRRPAAHGDNDGSLAKPRDPEPGDSPRHKRDDAVVRPEDQAAPGMPAHPADVEHAQARPRREDQAADQPVPESPKPPGRDESTRGRCAELALRLIREMTGSTTIRLPERTVGPEGMTAAEVQADAGGRMVRVGDHDAIARRLAGMRKGAMALVVDGYHAGPGRRVVGAHAYVMIHEGGGRIVVHDESTGVVTDHPADLPADLHDTHMILFDRKGRPVHPLTPEHREALARQQDPEAVRIRQALDDHSGRVRELLLRTPTGRRILASLTDSRYADHVDRGASADGRYGSFRRRDITAVVYADGRGQVAQALTLAHESVHAERYLNGESPADRPLELPRDDYVREMVHEEAMASGRRFQMAAELRELGYQIVERPSEAAYRRAYETALRGLEGPGAHEIAHEVAVDHLRNYLEHVSQNDSGRTYADHYRDVWNRAHDVARTPSDNSIRYVPDDPAVRERIRSTALERHIAAVRLNEHAAQLERIASRVSDRIPYDPTMHRDMVQHLISEQLRAVGHELGQDGLPPERAAELRRLGHDLRRMSDLVDRHHNALAEVDRLRSAGAADVARQLLGDMIADAPGARVLSDHFAVIPGEPERILVAAGPGDHQRVVRAAPSEIVERLARGAEPEYLNVRTGDNGEIRYERADRPDPAREESAEQVEPRDLAAQASEAVIAELQRQLNRVPVGSWAVDALRARGVTIEHESGGGSRYEPGRKRLVLDIGGTDAEQMAALVHGAVHAERAHEHASGDGVLARDRMEREEYVDHMIDEESAAHAMEFNALAQLREAGHRIPDSSLERIYRDAFADARERAAAREDLPDDAAARDAELDRIANDAGIDAIRPAVADHAPDGGASYARGYREAWDSANPLQDDTTAVRQDRPPAQLPDPDGSTYVNTYGGDPVYGIKGWVDEHGVLHYEIRVGPDTPPGREMFQDLMNGLGDRVEGIQDEWYDGGALTDNLDSFNAGVQHGFTPEESARRTFTGKLAEELGYTEVTFGDPDLRGDTGLDGPLGENTGVTVIFRHPDAAGTDSARAHDPEESGARHDPGDEEVFTGGAIRPRDVYFQDAWAKEAYERFRADDSDVDDIAGHLADTPRADGRVGFTRDEIARLKQHLMRDEHLLRDYETGGHSRRRFDESADIAEAWIRLRSGRPLAEDVVLLEHELREAQYLAEHPDATYAEAHDHANQRFNWEDNVPERTGERYDTLWRNDNGDAGVLRPDQGGPDRGGVPVRDDGGTPRSPADHRQADQEVPRSGRSDARRDGGGRGEDLRQVPDRGNLAGEGHDPGVADRRPEQSGGRNAAEPPRRGEVIVDLGGEQVRLRMVADGNGHWRVESAEPVRPAPGAEVEPAKPGRLRSLWQRFTGGYEGHNPKYPSGSGQDGKYQTEITEDFGHLFDIHALETLSDHDISVNYMRLMKESVTLWINREHAPLLKRLTARMELQAGEHIPMRTRDGREYAYWNEDADPAEVAAMHKYLRDMGLGHLVDESMPRDLPRSHGESEAPPNNPADELRAAADRLGVDLTDLSPETLRRALDTAEYQNLRRAAVVEALRDAAHRYNAEHADIPYRPQSISDHNPLGRFLKEVIIAQGDDPGLLNWRGVNNGAESGRDFDVMNVENPDERVEYDPDDESGRDDGLRAFFENSLRRDQIRDERATWADLLAAELSRLEPDQLDAALNELRDGVHERAGEIRDFADQVNEFRKHFPANDVRELPPRRPGEPGRLIVLDVHGDHEQALAGALDRHPGLAARLNNGEVRAEKWTVVVDGNNQAHVRHLGDIDAHPISVEVQGRHLDGLLVRDGDGNWHVAQPPAEPGPMAPHARIPDEIRSVRDDLARELGLDPERITPELIERELRANDLRALQIEALLDHARSSDAIESFHDLANARDRLAQITGVDDAQQVTPEHVGEQIAGKGRKPLREQRVEMLVKYYDKLSGYLEGRGEDRASLVEARDALVRALGAEPEEVLPSKYSKELEYKPDPMGIDEGKLAALIHDRAGEPDVRDAVTDFVRVLGDTDPFTDGLRLDLATDPRVFDGEVPMHDPEALRHLREVIGDGRRLFDAPEPDGEAAAGARPNRDWARLLGHDLIDATPEQYVRAYEAYRDGKIEKHERLNAAQREEVHQRLREEVRQRATDLRALSELNDRYHQAVADLPENRRARIDQLSREWASAWTERERARQFIVDHAHELRVSPEELLADDLKDGSALDDLFDDLGDRTIRGENRADFARRFQEFAAQHEALFDAARRFHDNDVRVTDLDGELRAAVERDVELSHDEGDDGDGTAAAPPQGPPRKPPEAPGGAAEERPETPAEWGLRMRAENASWSARMAARHALRMRELADEAVARDPDGPDGSMAWDARMAADRAEWEARFAAQRADWLWDLVGDDRRPAEPVPAESGGAVAHPRIPEVPPELRGVVDLALVDFPEVFDHPRTLAELHQRLRDGTRFDDLLAIRELTHLHNGAEPPALSRENLESFLREIWDDRADIENYLDVHMRYSDRVGDVTVHDPDAYVRGLIGILDGRQGNGQVALNQGHGFLMAGDTGVGPDAVGFVHYRRVGTDGAEHGYRVYVDANTDAAPELMRRIVHEIIDDPEAFPGVPVAKIEGPLAARADGLVIYAEDRAAARRVVDWLREFQEAHPDVMGRDVPAMTRQVLHGVGIGAEPPADVARNHSFGSLRSKLTREALDAHRDGTFEDFRADVLNRFRANDIDVERPHLHAGDEAGDGVFDPPGRKANGAEQDAAGPKQDPDAGVPKQGAASDAGKQQPGSESGDGDEGAGGSPAKPGDSDSGGGSGAKAGPEAEPAVEAAGGGKQPPAGDGSEDGTGQSDSKTLQLRESEAPAGQGSGEPARPTWHQDGPQQEHRPVTRALRKALRELADAGAERVRAWTRMNARAHDLGLRPGEIRREILREAIARTADAPGAPPAARDELRALLDDLDNGRTRLELDRRAARLGVPLPSDHQVADAIRDRLAPPAQRRAELSIELSERRTVGLRRLERLAREFGVDPEGRTRPELQRAVREAVNNHRETIPERQRRATVRLVDRYRVSVANESARRAEAQHAAERELMQLRAGFDDRGPRISGVSYRRCRFDAPTRMRMEGAAGERGRWVGVGAGADPELRMPARERTRHAAAGFDAVYHRIELDHHGRLWVSEHHPDVTEAPPTRPGPPRRPGDWMPGGADHEHQLGDRALRRRISDLGSELKRRNDLSDKNFAKIVRLAEDLGIDDAWRMRPRELAVALRELIAERRARADALWNRAEIPRADLQKFFEDRRAEEARAEGTESLGKILLGLLRVHDQTLAAAGDRVAADAALLAARDVLARHEGRPVDADGRPVDSELAVGRLVPGHDGAPDRLVVVAPGANPDRIIDPATRRALLGDDGEFVFRQVRVDADGRVLVAEMHEPPAELDRAPRPELESPRPAEPEQPAPDVEPVADPQAALDAKVRERAQIAADLEFWRSKADHRAEPFGDLDLSRNRWSETLRQLRGNTMQYVRDSAGLDAADVVRREQLNPQQVREHTDRIDKLAAALDRFFHFEDRLDAIDREIHDLEQQGARHDASMAEEVRDELGRVADEHRAAVQRAKPLRRSRDELSRLLDEPAQRTPENMRRLADAEDAVRRAEHEIDRFNDERVALTGAWNDAVDEHWRAVNGSDETPALHRLNEHVWFDRGRAPAEDGTGGRPARLIVVAGRSAFDDPDVPVREGDPRPADDRFDAPLLDALALHPELAVLLKDPDVVIDRLMVTGELAAGDRDGGRQIRAHVDEMAPVEIRRDELPAHPRGRMGGDRLPFAGDTIVRWRGVDGWHDVREGQARGLHAYQPKLPRGTELDKHWQAEVEGWRLPPKGWAAFGGTDNSHIPYRQREEKMPDGFSGTMAAEPFQNMVEPLLIRLISDHWPELSYEEILTLSEAGRAELWWHQGPGPKPEPPPGWDEEAHHAMPLDGALYTIGKRWVQLYDMARKHPWILGPLQRRPEIGQWVRDHTGGLPDGPFDPKHPLLRKVPIVRTFRGWKGWKPGPRTDLQPAHRPWSAADHAPPRDRVEFSTPRQDRDIARWAAVQRWADRVIGRFADDGGNADVGRIVDQLTRARDPLLDPADPGGARLDALNLARHPDGTPLTRAELTERIQLAKDHLMRNTMWVRDHADPTGRMIQKPYDRLPHVADAWLRLTGEGDGDGRTTPHDEDLLLLDDAYDEAKYLAEHPGASWHDADLEAARHGYDWDTNRRRLSGHLVVRDGRPLHPDELPPDAPEHDGDKKLRMSRLPYAVDGPALDTSWLPPRARWAADVLAETRARQRFPGLPADPVDALKRLALQDNALRRALTASWARDPLLDLAVRAGRVELLVDADPAQRPALAQRLGEPERAVHSDQLPDTVTRLRDDLTRRIGEVDRAPVELSADPAGARRALDEGAEQGDVRVAPPVGDREHAGPLRQLGPLEQHELTSGRTEVERLAAERARLANEMERLRAERDAATGTERDRAAAAYEQVREQVLALTDRITDAAGPDFLAAQGAHPVTNRVGIIDGDHPVVIVIGLRSDGTGGSPHDAELLAAADAHPEVAEALAHPDVEIRYIRLAVDSQGRAFVAPLESPNQPPTAHPTHTPPPPDGGHDSGNTVDQQGDPADPTPAQPPGSEKGQPKSDDGAGEQGDSSASGAEESQHGQHAGGRRGERDGSDSGDRGRAGSARRGQQPPDGGDPDRGDDADGQARRPRKTYITPVPHVPHNAEFDWPDYEPKRIDINLPPPPIPTPLPPPHEPPPHKPGPRPPGGGHDDNGDQDGHGHDHGGHGHDGRDHDHHGHDHDGHGHHDPDGRGHAHDGCGHDGGDHGHPGHGHDRRDHRGHEHDHGGRGHDHDHHGHDRRGPGRPGHGQDRCDHDGPGHDRQGHDHDHHGRGRGADPSGHHGGGHDHHGPGHGADPGRGGHGHGDRGAHDHGPHDGGHGPLDGVWPGNGRGRTHGLPGVHDPHDRNQDVVPGKPGIPVGDPVSKPNIPVPHWLSGGTGGVPPLSLPGSNGGPSGNVPNPFGDAIPHPGEPPWPPRLPAQPQVDQNPNPRPAPENSDTPAVGNGSGSGRGGDVGNEPSGYGYATGSGYGDHDGGWQGGPGQSGTGYSDGIGGDGHRPDPSGNRHPPGSGGNGHRPGSGGNGYGDGIGDRNGDPYRGGHGLGNSRSLGDQQAPVDRPFSLGEPSVRSLDPNSQQQNGFPQNGFPPVLPPLPNGRPAAGAPRAHRPAPPDNPVPAPPRILVQEFGGFRCAEVDPLTGSLHETAEPMASFSGVYSDLDGAEIVFFRADGRLFVRVAGQLIDADDLAVIVHWQRSGRRNAEFTVTRAGLAVCSVRYRRRKPEIDLGLWIRDVLDNPAHRMQIFAEAPGVL